ncbi:MAG: hypothetical protein U9O82_11105 [Thermodesulfobacteriota bacterium]|nr:hypothetical protein [Thermodesulfobacteriota bacterium]
MARIARVVVPLYPHHITQRGNSWSSWGMFLSDDVGEHEMDHFRKHERTGRPMGEESFIDKLECYLESVNRGRTESAD